MKGGRMALKAVDLNTPEDGMHLTTRDASTTTVEPVDELGALRKRIQAARAVLPKGRDLHCLDCFTRGRDAAIRAILEDV